MAGAVVVRAYTEVETGKRADRPELAKALADCEPRAARRAGALLTTPLIGSSEPLPTILDRRPASYPIKNPGIDLHRKPKTGRAPRLLNSRRNIN